MRRQQTIPQQEELIRQSLSLNSKPVIGKQRELDSVRQSGYSIHREQSNALPLGASSSMAQVQFKVVSYHEKQDRSSYYEHQTSGFNNIGTNHSSHINLGMVADDNIHRDSEGNRLIDMSELHQLLGN